MQYIYFLSNASLTLRLIDHLCRDCQFPTSIVTVIHRIDGWLVKIKFSQELTQAQHKDFQAYLSEIGIPYEPEIRLQMALWSLEVGQSIVDVMRRYQLAVVSHGQPNYSDIEAFREQFTKGLGYCPETLA
ncbi:hypothetical protein [Dactylococcopsis salina]|uniref:Uncharacterized protein n=1 Tax=Dactylococcopsis salina (strain PCC 8305) TaxID=13035 RepID=K9YRI7_DACS8|nr:hypothetical protein [Dactylococcopsis salina]AFZ49556.1 hypothetical protein Dacsa_0808 [Dactylococcopsis salina PCC 8305]